ncbi:putative F-box protein At1g47790 [Capsella rubella]|uniref:putative F-box protein At1g47790 n=1 Tax=Capsella rubella TaxID=81985 RepID=UPI000CD5C08D|nr:putative F-box protein At1g47790 [Capsella rubella]
MEKQEEEEEKRKRLCPSSKTLGFLHWEQVKNHHGDSSKVALNISLAVVDDASKGFCITKPILVLILLTAFQSEGILLAYQGKLALAWQASVISFDPFISLWVLEDAERHEWSFKRLSLPFPLEDPFLETSLFLKGVTSAGEFVYASSSWSVSFDPFHALYFDPKRNTVRRVIYQGLAEPEFRRDGLGKVVTMSMFPDHIESLLSV